MELYLEAVQKNNEVGLKVSDTKGEAWRAATQDTREACHVALDHPNSHRREHGC
jgi:hypothetical protein